MKKHIVCFGDSNTHGYCAMNDGRFDENERWTCFLQKNLGEDYLVLEEGLSGRTTCFNDPLFEGLSGLDYIYPCLMSHEPVDLLVIMLGTNDTITGSGSGHFIVLTGVTKDGYITIADCASRERTGKVYSVETIASYGRDLADGAFWIIWK